MMADTEKGASAGTAKALQAARAIMDDLDTRAGFWPVLKRMSREDKARMAETWAYIIQNGHHEMYDQPRLLGNRTEVLLQALREAD